MEYFQFKLWFEKNKITIFYNDIFFLINKKLIIKMFITEYLCYSLLVFSFLYNWKRVQIKNSTNKQKQKKRLKECRKLEKLQQNWRNKINKWEDC